jgi:putative Mg2+ transporter-C (MgtC) family protein
MPHEFNWVVFVDEFTRIGMAGLLGGILGLERELNGHFAGLRTHMMVAIGCAVFVMAGVVSVGDQTEALTRVVQGIAAGVGFLGAGTILKLDEEKKIKGLTTASSIWLAAALGTVAGFGEYALAAASAAIAIIVLGVLRPVERLLARWIEAKHTDTPKSNKRRPASD